MPLPVLFLRSRKIACIGVWLGVSLAGFLKGAGAPPAVEANAPVRPQRDFAAEIKEARSTWNRDADEIADLLAKLKQLSASLPRLERELAELRSELKQLQVAKNQALEDLRNGMFCTGCGRTRTELLAEGEPFPHPGQRSRPATPEEIAEAEEDFDRRIATLREKRAKLETQESQDRADLQSRLHALTALIPQYHTNLHLEGNVRRDAWLAEKDGVEEVFDVLQQSIEKSERSISAARSDDEQRKIESNLDTLRRLLAEKYKQAVAAQERAEETSSHYTAAANASMERLSRMAAELPNGPGMPGGWHIASRIRNPAARMAYFVAHVRPVSGFGSAAEVRDLLHGPKRGDESAAREMPQRDQAKTKSIGELLKGN